MFSTAMKYVLVGLGEILWDLLPSGKQLGGAPANFACHARNLLAEGIVASCVGNDELGRQILGRLDALQMCRAHVAIDCAHPTGTVSVEVNPIGDPAYIIREHVAWDFLPSSRALDDLADRAHAVCFGSLAQRSEVSRNTIRTFLEKTRADALRIFDVNLREPFYSSEVIDTSIQLANVLKLSWSELPVVAQLLSIHGDETSLLNELTRRYNLRLIALTKGEKGSVLFSCGRMSTHRGFTVKTVDSVGSGDAFVAALALGILNGYDLNRINDGANRIASFVCTQWGATPGLPQELVNLF